MSGTFELDGLLFPKDPIAKRWGRQSIATDGVGQSLYSSFWNLELSFGALEVNGEVSFFEDRWLTGGLHTVVVPHPETGNLTGFTGVNIQDFSYEFTDVDANSWGDGGRMALNHISLSATGTV